jgi:hypothetical protein
MPEPLLNLGNRPPGFEPHWVEDNDAPEIDPVLMVGKRVADRRAAGRLVATVQESVEDR